MPKKEKNEREIKKEKKLIKKLYILQLVNNGIPKEKKLPEKAYDYLELKKGRYWLKKEAREKIKVVATGGVFDIIHYGHILTLKEAKKLGDVLVVVLATDEVALRKGRKPLHEQDKRVEMLNAIKYVDIAIKGVDKMLDTINRIKPDIIAFGYDQVMFFVPGIQSVRLNVVYKPDVIKTSKILKQ
jgi:glycerol-3-phosphate cytidylyltransferase